MSFLIFAAPGSATPLILVAMLLLSALLLTVVALSLWRAAAAAVRGLELLGIALIPLVGIGALSLTPPDLQTRVMLTIGVSWALFLGICLIGARKLRDQGLGSRSVT